MSDEMSVAIELRGQTLVLHPERAAFWRDTGTLLVADPHWGKAATFRASGIPVPRGTTEDALVRLQSLLSRTGAQRVVFLGDLLHAKEGRSESTLSALAAWRRDNAAMPILLVRGNHDRRAGDPPAELEITCVDAPYEMKPFTLAHHPVVQPGGYVIAGHVHPGVTLHGAGRQWERLACFVIGPDTAILPAFGDFTGLAETEPAAGDAVYAIAGNRVVPIPSRIST